MKLRTRQVAVRRTTGRLRWTTQISTCQSSFETDHSLGAPPKVASDGGHENCSRVITLSKEYPPGPSRLRRDQKSAGIPQRIDLHGLHRQTECLYFAAGHADRPNALPAGIGHV